MKKRYYLIKIVYIILIFLVLVVVAILKNEFYSLFLKNQTLNYNRDINNIESLTVFCTGDLEFIEGKKNIIINDKADIVKIINYVNSLKVIEVDSGGGYDYNKENIYIDISLKGDLPQSDGFSFMLSNRYMISYNEKQPSQTKEYFIKDADYKINGKNKIYYFLYDLINSNKEKYKIE